MTRCLRELSLLIIALSLVGTVAHGNQEYALNRVASTRHGPSYSVAVLNGYAYVTGNDGVSVFDITDPSRPRLVATLELADGAFGLKFVGTTAYVAGDEDGLIVADFSDPENPVTLGSLDYGGVAVDVDAEGDLVYLADATEGLKVYDISDPGHPSRVGSYVEPGGEAYCVEMYEDRLYVADLQRGGLLLDFSDPSNIRKISGYSDAGPHDLVYADGYVFMACEEGLVVLEYGISEVASMTWMNYILPAAAALALVIGVLVYRKMLKG